jgi:hypothetical protein
MHNQEMLRAEIILYGHAPAGSGGSGGIVELGGGVLCLAPERLDASVRETRRVPIYSRIAKAAELPVRASVCACVRDIASHKCKEERGGGGGRW